MADPLVIMDDLELWLTSWFRSALAARTEPFLAGFKVDRTEPAYTELPARLLVVRDDGTSSESLLTGEASIGLTVLAATRENPKDAKDAARVILALARSIPAPRTPVAAFRGSNGPFLVADASPRARVYMTLTLAVAGRAL